MTTKTDRDHEASLDQPQSEAVASHSDQSPKDETRTSKESEHPVTSDNDSTPSGDNTSDNNTDTVSGTETEVVCEDGFVMKRPHWELCGVPRYSIGWRMGYLEQYSWEFTDWYEALPAHRQRQVQERFPPNFTWRHFYDDGEYGSSTDEDYAEDLAALEELTK